MLLGCALAAAVAPAPALAVDDDEAATDFVIITPTEPGSAAHHKFLSYGWNGWAAKVVHWRYDDANRPPAIVPDASAMVARIQRAMGQWSAQCAIRFVYDGPSSAGASLAQGGVRDQQNVITWGALSGNTTGVTWVSASGPNSASFTLDEADMVLNAQFNPRLDATLLHEIGHLLGLKHSDVEDTVMSGPNNPPEPSTRYSGLETLQADDIAGCRALYGAPVDVGADTRPMIEYRYAPLDYYFVTSRSNEQALLDTTPGWVRTGASFPVYVTRAVGAAGIVRFYFDRVARGGTRGSHFYTIRDDDVALLRAQNPGASKAPGLPQDEGIDAFAMPAQGGGCASGLTPVYRLFRGSPRFPDDPNHRFTPSLATYQEFMARGWDGEGVSFCVPTR